jgi:transcription elongation factor GreA
MTSGSPNTTLGEAASAFLASLSAEEGGRSQQAVYGFVRWYGWGRSFTELTAHEIANYAERLSQKETSYAQNLEIIRAFLTYARKRGWSKTNLATHLKIKKAKAKLPSMARRGSPAASSLTEQGYAKLEAELAELKNKRHQLIDEIRKAAADKDFRENAPLDAAREQQGHVEGRIMELEETLKSATIIDKTQKPSLKVSVGNSVLLSDIASGEELSYTIVGPREVDPTRGRISSNSPIGRALVGRAQGEIVEITAPLGKLKYEIKQIER